jgi:hypothetical protein
MVVIVAACSASPATAPSTATATLPPAPVRSATSSLTPIIPTGSPTPALVGQWEILRTCEAIIQALTKAGHPELIKVAAGELVERNVNGVVPADWNPGHPCANALPPTPHSHTFWPNGMFNSYDENGNQVDDGPWAILDGKTFTIGNSTFAYAIAGNTLRFEPVVPADCSGQCVDDLGWMFSVSIPGSAWHRVLTGPHVP